MLGVLTSFVFYVLYHINEIFISDEIKSVVNSYNKQICMCAHMKL